MGWGRFMLKVLYEDPFIYTLIRARQAAYRAVNNLVSSRPGGRRAAQLRHRADRTASVYHNLLVFIIYDS